jgi:hypothetical protein
MRPLHLALFAPLALLACASEPPPPPPAPVAQPTPPSNQVTFPTQAEVAAGRPIRIRPAANFGTNS